MPQILSHGQYPEGTLVNAQSGLSSPAMYLLRPSVFRQDQPYETRAVALGWRKANSRLRHLPKVFLQRYGLEYSQKVSRPRQEIRLRGLRAGIQSAQQFATPHDGTPAGNSYPLTILSPSTVRNI
jgi:hypothetical protein